MACGLAGRFYKFLAQHIARRIRQREVEIQLNLPREVVQRLPLLNDHDTSTSTSTTTTTTTTTTDSSTLGTSKLPKLTANATAKPGRCNKGESGDKDGYPNDDRRREMMFGGTDSSRRFSPAPSFRIDSEGKVVEIPARIGKAKQILLTNLPG